MKRHYLPILLLCALLVGACIPPATTVDTSVGRSGLAGPQELLFTATLEGWDAPASVPAGWTRITLDNQSDWMRQASFLRLDDDKTMDDVFAAIEAGMEGPPEWMTAYGGVSGVMPGDSRAVSVNLAAGQYIVIDPVPTPDGVPGMAKGYFMPITVEESDVATAAPTANMVMDLVDFAFIFDYNAVTAGTHTIEVTNSGPQEAHEVVFVKLDEGVSVQDFLGAMAPDAPAGPPPGTFVAGTAAFDEVSVNYLEVELEAGATYGLICFLPSTTQGGQPHFMLGMIGQFTVSS